jgi:carboxypeptidase family protein
MLLRPSAGFPEGSKEMVKAAFQQTSSLCVARMFRMLAVLVLALPATQLRAQLPNSQPTKTSIEGTVVSAANGQLLPRANVFLRNAKRPDDATFVRADDNGHFLIEGLDVGTYRLAADKQGFYMETRRSALQPTVEVGEGEHVKDVVIRLIPLAAISGRVVDDHSEPLQRVQVRLWSVEYYRGRESLNSVNAGSTDDRGEYRLFGIRPGSYYLMAEYDVNPTGRFPRDVKTREAEMAYPPILYPGTTDFPQAQRITIHAGDESRVDFALFAMPAVSIQGQVINGVTGRPAQAPSVTAYWGQFSGATARNADVSNKTGVFTIRGIGPGTYTLKTSFSEDGETYTDERVIEIGSAGIKNLQIAPLPDFDVNGRVHLDGVNYRIFSPTVEFAAIEKKNGNIFRVGTNTNDMQFTSKLHPGDRYKINVPNLPQDYYLKSVRVAGREVANNNVVIGGKHTEIELLVSPLGGHIEGTVTNANQEPASASNIFLVPDGFERIPPDMIRSVRSDLKGKFVLRGVPPGIYKLFAWNDVDVNEVLNQPDLLKNHESEAQSIRVEESGKYDIELKPVSAQ